jgi:hypothetical protein
MGAVSLKEYLQVAKLKINVTRLNRTASFIEEVDFIFVIVRRAPFQALDL